MAPTSPSPQTNRSITVALVQAAAGLEPEENRRRTHELVAAAVGKADADGGKNGGVDLAVLPEVFARDFGKVGSDISGFAEPLDGPFVSALVAAAAQFDTCVLAGMFEVSEDPSRPYNTLVLVDGGGVRASYRKIHLYDSFGYRESDRLTAGPGEPVVVDLEGVRLGLMTCYDLRFPELARLLVAEEGADALIVPAAWVAGEGKAEHWRTLTSARAIENTAYVLAVAQPAPRYCGLTRAVDPLGVVLGEAGEGSADGVEIVVATVEGEVVDAARGTNPSLANRRL